MTAILLPSGRLRYHAYIGGVYGPAVGYKLYTYEAGTTTPKATYSNSDAATPLANPIVLDSNGECAPYGTGNYKLKLTDPDGATVWTQDNVLLSSTIADEEWCGTAAGTADAITLSPVVGVTAYSSGQRLSFIGAAANTGAVTVNVSGVGAVALTKNGNTALAAGDIQLGRLYQIQYDGTRFQLANDPRATLTVTAPATSDDSDRVVTSSWVKDLTASDTQAGIIEIATDAEAQAGTDTARAITAANLKAAQIQLSASQASTSGTSLDFTGIPSWAKRVTVMFSAVSTNGTSEVEVRIGTASGVEATTYVSTASAINAAGASSSTNSTTGFIVDSGPASGSSRSGIITISKLTGNTWVFASSLTKDTGANMVGAGAKTLASTLDRVRVTTVGGANTFDAGTIAISYE